MTNANVPQTEGDANIRDDGAGSGDCGGMGLARGRPVAGSSMGRIMRLRVTCAGPPLPLSVAACNNQCDGSHNRPPASANFPPGTVR